MKLKVHDDGVRLPDSLEWRSVVEANFNLMVELKEKLETP